MITRGEVQNKGTKVRLKQPPNKEVLKVWKLV